MSSDPVGPPPSYDEAAASGSSARPPQSHPPATHLEVPNRSGSGIPAAARRSMEDEQRPLPSGWVRQFDAKSGHQFFVDTTVKPPRSIWSHPYDDQQYLNSLSPEEANRVRTMHPIPSKADMEAMSSDDDDEHHHATNRTDTSGGASAVDQPKGLEKFGRRMKDKITGSTHQQRLAARRGREEEERRAFERHTMLRNAMQKAAETGQPQLVGKDKNGKDVYIEPPGRDDGYGGQYGGQYGQNGYGYNPYSQGPYSNPNATYIRPNYGYSRPYGGGYGGGFGLPLAGGLMGGLLLGDMMGGGLGMGGMGMGGMMF